MLHTKIRLMVGGVDISLPNVSYCKDVKDINYNPYNTVEFYVGEITGTTPQTVKIYTDLNTSVDITVSEGNKWYTYLLPKDKGLYKITGGSVKKVVVKANISYEPNTHYDTIIPRSTIKASFKGSNTSKVTYMKWMFSGCTDITSLDVSNFNTSNVTNMSSMFYSCTSLTSLDVSTVDTSKVTYMGNMFSGCTNLTSLDLSGWDTSNVTNMNNMFYGCSGLTSLDVSNFNTSNVTNMGGMFNRCSGLTSLDLSHFDTIKVINMNYMFYNCSGLTFLDLSKWDTSKVTNMNQMFDGCTSLKTIRMVGCNQTTINKISGVKPSSATIVTE